MSKQTRHMIAFPTLKEAKAAFARAVAEAKSGHVCNVLLQTVETEKTITHFSGIESKGACFRYAGYTFHSVDVSRLQNKHHRDWLLARVRHPSA